MHYINKIAPLYATLVLIATFTVLGTTAQAQDDAPIALEQIWKTDTVFRTPESVLWDIKRKVSYVSNMAGLEDNAGADGFISLMDRDGKVTNLKWVTGLENPKGMGIWKSSLYVADPKELVEIDREKGTILNRYPAEGAIMLNDVAITQTGDIYVSDTRANKIYQLKKGKMEVFLDDPNLQNPNGLYATKTLLMVACAGSGKILLLDYVSKTYQTWATANQSADGIIKLDDKGNYLISCWHGEIFYVSAKGKSWKIIDSKDKKINTADMGFMARTKTLLVPNFFKNTVTAYRITTK